MFNALRQHRHSSQALAHNVSIFVKSRPSYLIIDIHPARDKNQQSNDRSFSSDSTNDESYSPNQDTSLNSIYFGIGLVAVALLLLVIAIKLIHKCYKMCKDDDDDEVKDSGNKSPLISSPTSVAVRRNSSIRNPSAPLHRSSLNIETQIELRQKRFSQAYEPTPPTV